MPPKQQQLRARSCTTDREKCVAGRAACTRPNAYTEWLVMQKAAPALVPARYKRPTTPAQRNIANRNACIYARNRGARIEPRDLDRGTTAAFWTGVPETGIGTYAFRVMDRIVARWEETEAGTRRDIALPTRAMIATLFTAIDHVVFHGTLRRRALARDIHIAFRVIEPENAKFGTPPLEFEFRAAPAAAPARPRKRPGAAAGAAAGAPAPATGAGARRRKAPQQKFIGTFVVNQRFWRGMTDARAHDLIPGLKKFDSDSPQNDAFVLVMMHEIVHLLQVIFPDGDAGVRPGGPVHTEQFYKLSRVFFGFRDHLAPDDNGLSDSGSDF